MVNKAKDYIKLWDIFQVVLSQRLVNTPCTLVTGQFGWTANMERLVKAQALQNNSTKVQSQMMASRKTMELNAEHPLIKKIKDLYDINKEDINLKDKINILFNIYIMLLIVV